MLIIILYDTESSTYQAGFSETQDYESVTSFI